MLMVQCGPCRILEYCPPSDTELNEAGINTTAEYGNGSLETSTDAEQLLAELRSKKLVTSEPSEEIGPKRLGWNEPLHEPPAPAPVNTYVLNKKPRDCTAPCVEEPKPVVKTFLDSVIKPGDITSMLEWAGRKRANPYTGPWYPPSLYPMLYPKPWELDGDYIPLEMNSPRSEFGYPLPTHEEKS
jgi:hypothetical protein